MSATEIDAFNAAVVDVHAACDWAREITDACECGDLELSDEEGQELVAMLKEKVETCERWQTALRFPRITIPEPLPAEPKPIQPQPAVAYARVGPLGIISCGAAPNSTFGSAVRHPGDWRGKR